MPTINGKVCVINGTPVDKVFSNSRQVYGRNLLSGTSGDLQTKQLTYNYNVGSQATNGSYKIKVFKGQTYTYRAWLDNTNGPVDAYVNTRLLPIGATASFSFTLGSPVAKGETGYSTSKFAIPNDGYIWFSPFAYYDIQTAFVGWKEEKLEKGSVATPWAPAPEDIQA